MTRNEIKSFTLKIWISTNVVMCRTPFYRTSNELEHHFFRTSNELECVHLLIIEFEHPTFGFERSNIELWTYLVRTSLIQGAKLLSRHFFFSKKATMFVLALLIDSVRFCWLGVFDRHDFRHATLITLGKHLATRVVLLCLLEFCIFSS